MLPCFLESLFKSRNPPTLAADILILFKLVLLSLLAMLTPLIIIKNCEFQNLRCRGIIPLSVEPPVIEPDHENIKPVPASDGCKHIRSAVIGLAHALCRGTWQARRCVVIVLVLRNSGCTTVYNKSKLTVTEAHTITLHGVRSGMPK